MSSQFSLGLFVSPPLGGGSWRMDWSGATIQVKQLFTATVKSVAQSGLAKVRLERRSIIAHSRSEMLL
jgi:hypothetical protein